MRIVLDAMGSDTHPHPEVETAFLAARQFDLEVLLVGQEEKLKPLIDQQEADPRVTLVHAPEVLQMTDKPARSARKKADNSMAMGMDLVKNGDAEAFVTAGNTGGAMANALFRLGRIRGVKRPGLTAIIPTRTGRAAVVDIGANADCKALYLLQFGIMGSLYVEHVLGVREPRVGLLSNGEEKGKGNQLVQETYPLFEASGLNFAGNVEPKELFSGQVDVVVTDGFAGNVLIKTSESVADLLLEILKEELTGSLRTKLGAGLAMPAFKNVKHMLDPREIGAAPLLGIDGLVFVGHGRSDAQALVSAVRIAKQAVENDLLQHLRSAIQDHLKG